MRMTCPAADNANNNNSEIEGATVIKCFGIHSPERCKHNKFNAQKFSKGFYWLKLIMGCFVEQHQTIHCPLKQKKDAFVYQECKKG